MRKLFLLFGLICMVVSCDDRLGSFGSQGSMDWNLFRGDAELSGYTNQRLPEKVTLLWSYKSDSRTSSSPIINKGITYWSDKRGQIFGININGELCFEYDLKTAVEASPMIHDSILYIGRIDGFVTAISLANKDTIWNFETMGQVSASANSMSFEGKEAIVFGSYDNFLYCVNTRTGSLINQFESGYYLNGAAALWKNHVIFGGCDSWLRIINCETGIQTDSLLLDAYVPASPAVIGDYCYIGDYSGNIYELLLEKGKIARYKKISEENSDNGSFVSVPALTAEAIYFLSDDRHLCSIDRKTGTENWRYMLNGNVGESSPVVCRDKIIVCTKTGIVSIIDAKNGELKWEYDTGEQIIGSPAVIKDHFMVLTGKGTLLCFGKAK